MAESEERKGPGFWFIAAGSLVVLVLVGGAVFGGLTYFLGPKDANAEPQPGESSAVEVPSAQGSSTGPASQEGECNVPSEDQSYPVEAPETKWEMYENVVMVPTSETYGPTKRDGKFWQCFAHSPTGALFAATVLQTNLSDGLVKEAALPSSEADRLYEMSVNAPQSHSTPVSGFQYLEYTPEKATINFLYEEDGYTATMARVVVWDPALSDWRADFTATGIDFVYDGIDTNDFVTWEP